MELRQEDIAEIVRIFNDSDLQELRLEIGGNRLYLSKQAGGSARWEDAAEASSGGRQPAGGPAEGLAPGTATDVQRAAPGTGDGDMGAPGTGVAARGATAAGASDLAAGASAAPAAAGLVELTSPLLGVFYRRPAPDKPAFVEVGSEVAADDPVCIIDVMKMFSRVPAGTAGRVVEILAEDGQLVEHGQVLMRLEPR